MIDLSQTVTPKSDQINADDLIAGPRTIRITRVTASPESPEQPVSVYFDGDNGKPFKPCKSMRRVMIAAWGPDASVYPGRALTIYRDPKVAFGGMQVGGIRISHMSHIDRDMTMALTMTKAKRAPYTVHVLREAVQKKEATPQASAPDFAAEARLEAGRGTESFRAWYNSEAGKAARASGALSSDVMADCKAIASGADAMRDRLANDPFAPSDPDPSAATDAEIAAQIARELDERNRSLEG